jgi:sporulation protein YlmC with PRC-barrel domain
LVRRSIDMNNERKIDMNYETVDTDFVQTTEVVQEIGPSVMSASTLIGDEVYNLKNEELGDVKDIMLNMRTGKVAYAVLSFGGFLGMGEKLFAVPWAVLKLDAENKRFTLDVNKERLENAPGFDKDSWPNMADPVWENEIHAYYGTTPGTY